MKFKLPELNTFIATFFGIGFLPKMPGTWGSLAALGLYLMLPAALFMGKTLLLSIPLLIVLCLVSVYFSGKAEKYLGHDSPHIVIDEVCGYFVAVMFLPHNWLIGVYAFVFFRVFDIAKPYPIGKSQNIPRGWGVVIDDVLAGVLANILTQILIKIYPGFFGL